MAGIQAGISVKGARLDTALLDKLTAEIRPFAAHVVQSYGLTMMSDAARMAPYDTGALMNSITSESGPVGDLTFVIQDGVEYGVYQELGTSKMAAHPFLVPAIEKWAQKFQDAFKEIFK